MMAAPPPRKRQRRLKVHPLGEEDPSIAYSCMSQKGKENRETQLGTSGHRSSQETPPTDKNVTRKRRPKPRATQVLSQASNGCAASPEPSPTPSPEKRKARKKPIPEKSKSLHSFFAPASEEQRWSKIVDRHTPDVVEEIEEVESEEDMPSWTGSRSADITMRPRDIKGSQLDAKYSTDSNSATQAADNNLKPTKRLPKYPGPSMQSFNTTPSPGQSKPWAERFAPVNLDELAVHKKKVVDVQKWLADVFAGRSKRRILVLRGPAGSGKTTTISLLSKVIGYDIVEWKNTSGADYSSAGYVSMGAQFDDFIARGGNFNSLLLAENTASSPSNPNFSEASGFSRHRKRVMLIEEFPSSLTQGSSTLLAFRATLQRYLATAVPTLGLKYRPRAPTIESSPPIVIIVSETMLGTGPSLSDNFTVHRLLGPEISNHPSVSVIEFNPVAPTFITKAIDLVLKKEARISKRRRIPGHSLINEFAGIGDIRSAIASLEFLCLFGDEDGDWSGTLAGRIKKGAKPVTLLTEMEKESLIAITHRESSLGLFHAVGKVVYNKREDPMATQAPDASLYQLPQPPQHLHHFARQKASQVSIDDLINATGTDIQTFIAALHENFVLSCGTDDFTDNFTDCIVELSNSDILAPESRRTTQSTRSGAGLARFSSLGGGISVDLLRQDEISFQVAVRGLLFSLPHPVKRQAPPGTRGADAHKMFFPTSMRLWRTTEELCGLLDVWTHRIMQPSLSKLSSDSTSRLGGVESWGNRLKSSLSTAGEDAPAPVRSMMSTQETLLEYLPYLRLIKKCLYSDDLEKLTRFRGTAGPNNDLSDEDIGALESGQIEHWATDPITRSPQKRHNARKMPPPPRPQFGRPGVPAPIIEEAVEKLVLSDDDIED